MSKRRNIGYIIELNPEGRIDTCAFSNLLCDLYDADVFSTREKAREDKRRFDGNHVGIIYQAELDDDGRPVRIIKKVR